MSLVKDILKQNVAASQEGCSTCEQAAVNGGSMANGAEVKEIKPTLVITGKSSQKKKDSGGFTYNDGDAGKKQLIQLTGPLGQAYTDALNIVYSKQPVLDIDDMPEDVSEEDMTNILTASRIAQDLEQQAATESYLTNGDRVHVAINEIVSAPAMKIIDDKANVRIVDEASVAAHAQNAANTTPNVIGYITTVADVVKPEAYNYIERVAELKDTHVVVVVADATRWMAKGMGTRQRFVDLTGLKNHNAIFDKPETDITMESMYGHLTGVSFVRSFEEFMQVVDEYALTDEQPEESQDAISDVQSPVLADATDEARAQDTGGDPDLADGQDVQPAGAGEVEPVEQPSTSDESPPASGEASSDEELPQVSVEHFSTIKQALAAKYGA